MESLLSSEAVSLGLKGRCKREVLASISREAGAMLGLSCETIRDALMEREQLGSTGVGGGVAIPHGRVAGLSAVTGFLAVLDKPVDFDAVDGAPVDIVFVLLAPADATAAHLKALAKVSRLLRDEHARASIRGAQSAEALFAAATADARRPDAA